MSKEPLYPHLPKHPALSEKTGSLNAVYEAHNKELELMGQFQQGLLSPTETASEAELLWKQALSIIIRERR